MSYEYVPSTDDFRDSEKNRYLRERRKVNTDIFTSRQDIKASDAWCMVCRVRYLTENNGNSLFCKKCGDRKPVYTTLASVKKLMGRYGSNTASRSSGPMIISQKRKTRRNPILEVNDVNSHLSDEDRLDLRGAGYMI